MLERPELAIGTAPEELLWMGLPLRPQPQRAVEVESRVFPDTGYAAIRSARSHAVFDVGAHGFLNGGHAHADALSFVLTIDGRPLLVDPGTATYTMDPAMRDRFRSTAMHNTVMVDGRPQSIPAGPFHWQTHTDSELVRWSPAGPDRGQRRIGSRDRLRASQHATLDYFEAEHSGYAPLVHRRALVRTDADLWIVCDQVLGEGLHLLESFWHLHPDWLAEGTGTTFRHRDGALAAFGSTAGRAGIGRGEPDGLGWFAPVYGRLQPATTLRLSSEGRVPLSIVTVIAAATHPVSLSVETVFLPADESAVEWHRTAVLGKWNGQAFLALFTTPASNSVPTSRPLHRVPVKGAEFLTDARVALMWLTPSGRPVSADLIDGRWAAWTGDGAFSFAAEDEAANLHLDLSDVGSSAESNARR